MLDNLVSIVSQIHQWGYVVIFIVVMLECQALLGLFIPGESLVLVSGFFAHQGAFDPVVLVVVVALAAIAGDSIGYELGHYLGLGWLLKHGKRWGVRQEHLDRVEGFIKRHGGKAVFASHFLHLMRALMPFIAGASRLPYRRFLSFNSVGCVVWATLFVLLGYFVGASWKLLEHWISRVGLVVGLLLVVAFGAGWFFSVRKAGITRKAGNTVTGDGRGCIPPEP